MVFTAFFANTVAFLAVFKNRSSQTAMVMEKLKILHAYAAATPQVRHPLMFLYPAPR